MTTITSLLDSLGAVFTFLIGKVGEVFAVITANPIALIPIGVIFAYTIIKFTRRILGY